MVAPYPGGAPGPGPAANSDIPALKALEHYFDSQASFQNDTQKEANLEPIFEKAQTSLSRRRRRELERRASAPRETENSGDLPNSE